MRANKVEGSSNLTQVNQVVSSYEKFIDIKFTYELMKLKRKEKPVSKLLVNVNSEVILAS